MKTAVGTLKSDLQQFRELQAFAAFGSELDAVSQAQLDRGVRLTELLKQGLNSPLPVQEQVVVIYAGTRGYLDPIPVSDVRRFESGLLEWFRTRYNDILLGIKSSGNIGDTEAFESAMQGFADQFLTTADGGGAEPEATPQGAAKAHMVDAETTLPEAEIEREDR
jgi:F-type H+-transporting ATPase subunit alpha